MEFGTTEIAKGFLAQINYLTLRKHHPVLGEVLFISFRATIGERADECPISLCILKLRLPGLSRVVSCYTFLPQNPRRAYNLFTGWGDSPWALSRARGMRIGNDKR